MKLSHKEHMARAMLLGLVYDWRDGSYCKIVPNFPPRSDRPHAQSPTWDGALDCETMLRIDERELHKRWVLDKNMHPTLDYDSKPDRTVPWARDDDE